MTSDKTKGYPVLTCDIQTHTDSTSEVESLMKEHINDSHLTLILDSVLAALKLFFYFVEQSGMHQKQRRSELKKSVPHSVPIPLPAPVSPVCNCAALFERQRSM